MRFNVDHRTTDNGLQYYIWDSEENAICIEPSKYLKHKKLKGLSPNTVKQLAFHLSYYLNYLHLNGLSIQKILEWEYLGQQGHFCDYLSWLKAGCHTDRKGTIKNNTCNSYLKHVLDFYSYLKVTNESDVALKVLGMKSIGYANSAGVRYSKVVNSFDGYLIAEKIEGKTIKKENIDTVIEATNNIRNKLLIAIMAEAGLRIGEALGIRYASDIDYGRKLIKVNYRELNENNARAKNAEIRELRISEATFDLLTSYISENRELLSKSDYLFVNLTGPNKGKALNVNAVYSVIRKIENKTGVKMTPHMLRHYCANERRKNGWPIEQIAWQLGHKNIATTMCYLNVEDSEMLNVQDEYFKKYKGVYDISKLY